MGWMHFAVKQSCEFAIEHAPRDGHILRN